MQRQMHISASLQQLIGQQQDIEISNETTRRDQSLGEDIVARDSDNSKWLKRKRVVQYFWRKEIVSISIYPETGAISRFLIAVCAHDKFQSSNHVTRLFKIDCDVRSQTKKTTLAAWWLEDIVSAALIPSPCSVWPWSKNCLQAPNYEIREFGFPDLMKDSACRCSLLYGKFYLAVHLIVLTCWVSRQ